MFQNQQLASYVSQLGLQQQAQLQRNRSGSQNRSSGAPMVSPGSQVINIHLLKSSGKAGTLMGGLPRQSRDDGAQPENLNSAEMQQAMVVGNRLSMSTYAKKESFNPQAQAVPGFPGSLQKTLQKRQQQLKGGQQTPSNQVKSVKQQQPQVAKDKAGAQERGRSNSLNSDLVTVGKQKKQKRLAEKARAVADKKQPQTGDGSELITPRERNMESKFLNVRASKEEINRGGSLYKGIVSPQTLNILDTNQSNRMDRSVIEAEHETSSYYPMNIEVKTSLSNTYKQGIAQDNASGKPQYDDLDQSSFDKRVHGDHDQPLEIGQADDEDEFVFQGLTVNKRKSTKQNGKEVTQLTVKQPTPKISGEMMPEFYQKRGGAKTQIDQAHLLDSNHSVFDNLATSSVVTQREGIPEDDYNAYQTTQMLQNQSKTSQKHHQRQQSYQQDYQNRPSLIISQEEGLRKSCVIVDPIQNETAISATAGLQQRLSITALSPNLDRRLGDSVMIIENDRARTTSPGQNLLSKTQLVTLASKGQTKGEGGVTTTLVQPPDLNNAIIIESGEPQFKKTFGLINQLDILTAKRNSQELGHEVSSSTKLEDRNENETHGGLTTNMLSSETVPVNFSNMELKQQQALQGITGFTLSQHLTKTLQQNKSIKAWQSKKSKVYLNENRRIHTAATIAQPSATGMKGAKLAKNSHFGRMNANSKKRTQEMNQDMLVQAHTSNGASDQNITTALQSSRGPIFALIEANSNNELSYYVNNVIQGTSPSRQHAAINKSVDRTANATKKQSIFVNQHHIRPKTQDENNRSTRNGTRFQDLPSGLNRANVDISPYPDNSPIVGGHAVVENQNFGAQISKPTRNDLRSYNSSHEQPEPLTAVLGQLQEMENGTVMIASPQHEENRNADLHSQLNHLDLKQQSTSPMENYPMIGDENFIQTFPQTFRQDSFGALVNSTPVREVTEKMSFGSADKDQSVLRATRPSLLIGSQIMEDDETQIKLGGVPAGILDIRTEINPLPSPVNAEQLHRLTPHMQEMTTGQILNFPLPEAQLRKKQHEIRVDARIDKQNPHVSPQMRVLQKKDGLYKGSRSHVSQQRRRTANPSSIDEVVIGTRYKPQIVFKQNDLQSLFDQAEQPVQEIIERVLLDDFDKFTGFNYTSQKRKSQGAKLHAQVLAARPENHVKYEFIEKVLKQSDKDLTSKTLQEMTNLYQELLEKNLTISSSQHNFTAKQNLKSLQDSIQMNSQGSIIIQTDRKNTQVFYGINSSADGHFNENQRHDQDESVITKRQESQSKLQTMRGSVQLKHEPLNFKPKNPQPPAQQSMSLIDQNGDKNMNTNGKVSVGKIIQNSSGGNTLFLDLGRQQHWSTSNREIGNGGVSAMQNQEKPPLELNKTSIEIEGKKIDILNTLAAKDDHDMVNLEDNMVSGTANLELAITKEVTLSQIDKPSPRQKRNAKVLLSHTSGQDQPLVSNATSSSGQRPGTGTIRMDDMVNTAVQSFDENVQSSHRPATTTQQEHGKQQWTASKTQPTSQVVSPNNRRRHESAKAGTVSRTMKNRKERLQSQLNYVSLSPRIHELSNQIVQNIEKPQVKTNEDVQNAVHVLTFDMREATPITNTVAAESTNPPSTEQIRQMTAHRSAYLTQRANKLNNSRVIVGKEVRDQKERQKFVEELLLQTQLNAVKDSKVARVQSYNTTKSGTKHSEIFAGKDKEVMDRKSNLRASQLSNYTAGQQKRTNTNSPPHIEEIQSKIANKAGSSSGFNMIAKSTTGQSQLKIKKEQPSVVHYQRKQETKEDKKTLQDYAKTIQPQEHQQIIKVPKVGQLDALKASHLRQLSSNQLNAFKLRGHGHQVNSYDFDSSADAKKLQSSALVGLNTSDFQSGIVGEQPQMHAKKKSNVDLAGFLQKKQRNRSQYNMLAETVTVENKDKLDHPSSNEDAEEVGTQMMLSRGNLTLSFNANQLNPFASPKAMAAKQLLNESTSRAMVHEADDEVAQNNEESAAALPQPSLRGEPPLVPAKQEKYVEFGSLVNTNQLQPNTIKRHHSTNNVRSHQKIGTIKVKELYQNADERKNGDVSAKRLESSAKTVSQHAAGRVKTAKAISGTQARRGVLASQQQMGSLRIRADVKSKSQTADFERLSGLITESHTDQRKARLMAHYKRIKDAKKEERTSQDWRRATPGISHGSTFYKDLFDIRGKHRASDTLNTTMQPGTNSVLDSVRQSDAAQDEDALLQQMMNLNHTQNRPHISNLLGRNPNQYRQKKETFTISRNAVNQQTKQLISQLLSQVIGSSIEPLGERKTTEVSALKQNCLIQYILDEWSSTTKSQLKHFNQFCTFTDGKKVAQEQQQDGKDTTDAYSVILYGKQTPVSLCCHQLICFQFAKLKSQVIVYCLEPSCRKSKLETRVLNQEIYHSIFVTAQNRTYQSTKTSRVIYQSTSKSQAGTRQSAQQPLVSTSMKHQMQVNLRKRVLIASQQMQRKRMSVNQRSLLMEQRENQGHQSQRGSKPSVKFGGVAGGKIDDSVNLDVSMQEQNDYYSMNVNENVSTKYGDQSNIRSASIEKIPIHVSMLLQNKQVRLASGSNKSQITRIRSHTHQENDSVLKLVRQHTLAASSLEQQSENNTISVNTPSQVKKAGERLLP